MGKQTRPNKRSALTIGKSSPSPPPAPDPVTVANAQSSSNIETATAQARLNQLDEFSPYGSSVYSPTGQTVDGIKQYKRTVSLSPAQQAILDAQNSSTLQAYDIGRGQLDRIGDTLSTPFGLSGLPPAPTGNEAYRQDVQDALFNRARSQLDPMFEERQKKLETQLVNEGHSRGGPGYDNALQTFGRERNGAYDDASWNSIINAGNAAAQQYGMQAGARQNALAEMLTQRNQPIAELGALLGTSGGLQTPQFSATPQGGIAPTDVQGPIYAQYQAQQNAYNQQQAQNNALSGSLFGLAGKALGGWLGGI
jgi:hypothetical protein